MHHDATHDSGAQNCCRPTPATAMPMAHVMRNSHLFNRIVVAVITSTMTLAGCGGGDFDGPAKSDEPVMETPSPDGISVTGFDVLADSVHASVLDDEKASTFGVGIKSARNQPFRCDFTTRVTTQVAWSGSNEHLNRVARVWTESDGSGGRRPVTMNVNHPDNRFARQYVDGPIILSGASSYSHKRDGFAIKFNSIDRLAETASFNVTKRVILFGHESKWTSDCQAFARSVQQHPRIRQIHKASFGKANGQTTAESGDVARTTSPRVAGPAPYAERTSEKLSSTSNEYVAATIAVIISAAVIATGMSNWLIAYLALEGVGAFTAEAAIKTAFGCVAAAVVAGFAVWKDEVRPTTAAVGGGVACATAGVGAFVGGFGTSIGTAQATARATQMAENAAAIHPEALVGGEVGGASMQSLRQMFERLIMGSQR